jgi:hypothetical protein
LRCLFETTINHKYQTEKKYVAQFKTNKILKNKKERAREINKSGKKSHEKK